MQIDAVVGTACREEAGVVPVAEVAVDPGRHALSEACVGLVEVGTGEGLQEEGCDLLRCWDNAVSVGWDSIVSVFIVVVSEKNWLCFWLSNSLTETGRVEY